MYTKSEKYRGMEIGEACRFTVPHQDSTICLLSYLTSLYAHLPISQASLAIPFEMGIEMGLLSK